MCRFSGCLAVLVVWAMAWAAGCVRGEEPAVTPAKDPLAPAKEPEAPLNPPDAAEADPSLRPFLRPIRPYVAKYSDGLYSTIVVLLTTGAPQIKNQKRLDLDVPGFKKNLSVQAIVQDKAAPLIVVLVGVDGKSDTPLGRLFPFWLGDTLGYHVLSFDSTFRPAFVERSRHGVAGNLAAEAELVAQVTAAFLKRPELDRKVTRVGIVGYSLGGTQAMVLARMAADGKLPFELTGAVAFSPIVRLKSAARIADRFYNEDRFQYTAVDMYKKFASHEPVKPGDPIPFEPALMRGGIGYIVRDQFAEIVDRNDELFRLKLVPEDEGAVNRKSICEAWGFEKFITEMSVPYWKNKKVIQSEEDLWNGADLTLVMRKLPPYARAVICQDDPFVAPEDVEDLHKNVDAKYLEILPRGGHLGYVDSAFCFAHLVQLFRFK